MPSLSESDIKALLLDVDVDEGVAAQLKAALLDPIDQIAAEVEKLDEVETRTWRQAQAYVKAYETELKNTLDTENAIAEAKQRHYDNEFAAAQRRVQDLNTEYNAEQAFADRLREVRAAEAEADQASFEAIQQNIKGINDEAEAEANFAAQIRQAKAAREEFNLAQQYSAGYGVEGGMIGPAEAEGGSGGGSAGGRAGSLFGLGRAALVAGRATGLPELTGLGEALYMAEGLKLAKIQFDALNKSAGASGLAGALAELGIPMAGLAAVVGIVAAGLAVVAGGFIAIRNSFSGLSDAFNEVIGRVKAYNDAIHGGATQSDIELQKVKAQSSQASGTAQDVGAQTFAQLQAQYGDFAARFMEAYGTAFIPGLGAMNDASKKAGDSAKEASGAILGLNDAQTSETIIANSLADAARKKADADLAFNAQLRADDAMNAKSAQQKSDDLKQQNIDLIEAIDTVQKSDESSKLSAEQHLENKKKIDEYTASIQQNQREIDHLIEVSIPRAKALEDEAELLKKVTAANEELNKAREDYAKGVKDTEQQMADQKAAAISKEAQAEAELTQGSLQDTYERTRIAEAEGRKEAELAQQTADKIIDIRLKEGQKEGQLKIDLGRQLADDQTKVNQDYQKLLVDNQRQQVEDAIDHQQKLADINRQSNQDGIQALLDRNFLALQKSQVGHQEAVDKENTSYQRREEQLSRHLQYQEQDLERKYAQEIAAQNLAYNRKLEDARAAEDLEIYQARMAENRKLIELRTSAMQQLADLTTQENFKITMLRHNLFDLELPLIEQQEKAKLALMDQTLVEIQKRQIGLGGRERSSTETFGGQSINVPGAAGARTFDTGGSFGPGDVFRKGELTEFIQAGAGGYNLGGSALVYPLSSGTITPSSGGKHVENLSVNIYPPPGTPINAEMIKTEIANAMDKLFPDD